MKKNPFFTFICACLPGFGQMYQGYMKRGFSLLLWFIAVPVAAFIAQFLFYEGFFIAFFMIPIWAYSFFDTFNIRNMPPEQRASFPDTPIPNLNWENLLSVKKKAGRANRVLGWTLIIVGGLLVYNNFSTSIASFLSNVSGVNYSFVKNIFSIVLTMAIGVAIILLGIRMLKGPKAKGDDDFPAFDAAAHSHETQAPVWPEPMAGEENNAAEPGAQETTLSPERVETVEVGAKDILPSQQNDGQNG